MPDYVGLGADIARGGDPAGFFPDSASIVCGAREQLRPPRWIQDRLTRVGGRNLYGEPRLRLIWGWTPTELRYSARLGRYERRPRYPDKNRWHVEQWFPAEFYGIPKMWEFQYTQRVNGKLVDLLGPYPARGGYEHLVTVDRRHRPRCPTPEADRCLCGGGYVELTPDVVEDLCHRVARGRDVNPWTRRAEVISEIEQSWEKEDPEADAIIRDAQPAFDLKAHVALDKGNLPTKGPGWADYGKGEFE